MSVTVIQGSIFDFKGDCIVNAANSHLRHGAGIAKAIADAAAPKGSAERAPWWKEQFDHPLIPTGGCGITSAGALPYKAILHAVGPVWGNGTYCEARLLRMAHLSALDEGKRAGGNSIAFPAISCGIFGYPADLAAKTAVATVRAFGNNYERIEFYIPEDDIYEAFHAAL